LTTHPINIAFQKSLLVFLGYKVYFVSQEHNLGINPMGSFKNKK